MIMLSHNTVDCPDDFIAGSFVCLNWDCFRGGLKKPGVWGLLVMYLAYPISKLVRADSSRKMKKMMKTSLTVPVM